MDRGIEILLTYRGDLIECREIDANSSLYRQQVTFERGTRAKSDDRCAMTMAQTDDFGDFSSPYNDGDYMSFASPGALSNDYGTF